MNSLTTIGEAMLLAQEGQQQIARALVEALGRGLGHVMARLTRRISALRLWVDAKMS